MFVLQLAQINVMHQNGVDLKTVFVRISQQHRQVAPLDDA
jgi:hypothetical protein